ncbi:MAG: hypothetical protein JWO09_673 [Bacteroidetes bacterium]|nr:hypothetical protein [Bacteroidota bacterium]
MMKHNYLLFISGIILLTGLLGSCNLYNPAEPVPSYIHIQKIDLSTDPALEGSSSSKITDAWVYIDGHLLGAYELPVTFPVLEEGTHEILVKAGIKVNGISATRAPYPFYNNFKQSITLTRGAVTTVSPAVQYVSGLDWEGVNIWKEDFENPSGITLDTSASGTDTNMYHHIRTAGSIDAEVFEGEGSGVVYIDHKNTFFEYWSSKPPFVLPRGDAPVFLELNYRSNFDFVVGVYAHSSAGTVKTRVLNIHPSYSWNKIYIYLSPTIAATAGASDYSIFFGMLNNSGADGLYLNIDNIKLIHY